MFPALMRVEDNLVMDATGVVFTVLDDIEYVELDTGEAPHCHVNAWAGEAGPSHPELWMVGFHCLDFFGVNVEVEMDLDEEWDDNPFLSPDEPFA